MAGGPEHPSQGKGKNTAIIFDGRDLRLVGDQLVPIDPLESQRLERREIPAVEGRRAIKVIGAADDFVNNLNLRE